MRTSIFSVLALAAFLAPSLAAADNNTSDRGAAIQLCRTQVAAQAGVSPEQIRLDQARETLRRVRVDLDVWRGGQLQNVRCDVVRGAELTVASITPPVQTASAQ
jgi:hypothetical protein